MAYIGNKPTVGNFQICDAISVVNGQAAYTMQVGSVNVLPETANHMIVSLNGVIQKPNSSYTIAGAVITFSSNLATGDVIDFIQILGDVLDLGVPSDATVSTAKLQANSVTSAKLNNDIISGATELATTPADTDEFLVSDAGTLKRIDYSLIKGGGITMADQWRQSASSSISGQDKTYITSNWERTDSDSYGTIGSAMTESSGVFTFPTTGIYYLQFFFQGKNTSGSVSRYTDGFIDVTTNNSSYNQAASGFASSAGNLRDFNCTSTFILDVTNTSNVKIKTAFQVEHTCSMYGSSDSTSTNLTVIRLGDT